MERTETTYWTQRSMKSCTNKSRCYSPCVPSTITSTLRRKGGAHLIGMTSESSILLTFLCRPLTSNGPSADTTLTLLGSRVVRSLDQRIDPCLTPDVRLMVKREVAMTAGRSWLEPRIGMLHTDGVQDDKNGCLVAEVPRGPVPT